MRDSRIKTATFNNGYNFRLAQLVEKQIEAEEMAKEAAGLARLAGRAVGGAGRAVRGVGRWMAGESPLIPGALGRGVKNMGQEFNLARQGIARGSNEHLEQMGLGGTGWKGPGAPTSNAELHSMGVGPTGYTPPGGAAGAAGTTTGTAGATGAAGAAAAGLNAPSGAQRWLSKTLGPGLAHYPLMGMQLANKHPGLVGAAAGVVGMHGLHSYEDSKRREAIANMGAMDRLQAALGLVFNPQATANRLY